MIFGEMQKNQKQLKIQNKNKGICKCYKLIEKIFNRVIKYSIENDTQLSMVNLI